jgi:hypothetical protein
MTVLALDADTFRHDVFELAFRPLYMHVAALYGHRNTRWHGDGTPPNS